MSLQCATYDQTDPTSQRQRIPTRPGRSADTASVTGPGQTCQLRIDPDDGPNINRNIRRQRATTQWTSKYKGILLSGWCRWCYWSVSYGWMSIDSPTAGQAATTSIGPDGSFSVLSVEANPRLGGFYPLFKPARQFTEDTVIDLAPPPPPPPNLIGADGSDVWASDVAAIYATYDYQTGQQTSVNGYQRGPGPSADVQPRHRPRTNLPARIDPDDGPNINRNIEVGRDTGLTIFTFGGRIVIDGDGTTTNDGDSVADAVEGRSLRTTVTAATIGTPDCEQENVIAAVKRWRAGRRRELRHSRGADWHTVVERLHHRPVRRRRSRRRRRPT